ncbi:MAG: glycosyltransferase [Pseudomonadota bacterium]
MTLAYLMNSYPVPSATFVRDEIAGLEAAGLPVRRFAVRSWAGTLVDERDIAEQDHVSYLLDGNIAGLFWAALLALVTSPLAFFAGLGVALKLRKRAGRGTVRHGAYFLQAIYFRRVARARDITHVHAHFSTNATAVAMISAAMGGPGYSFTVHGPDELLDPAGSSLAQKIDGARFVVAITDFCRSQLIWFGGHGAEAKIKVMRCGVDVAAITPRGPVADDCQHFVCVGRLCPQKGQTALPGIVARLRKAYPQIAVTLIGDGESRAAVEAQIAHHEVAAQFTLLGFLPHAQAMAHVATARAFILPSAAEGLPIAIMEALAHGVPVISTYIAGIPELLDGQCGWIIPAGNAARLEAAMAAALAATPDQLQAMGVVGRKRVEKAHRADQLTENLLSAYGPFLGAG